ncbi:MAG: oligoendopeptidase F [Proteobacteria bacterium]|nr:MAG: oligoendopeptidase F [Pseudomonadota bacterium]
MFYLLLRSYLVLNRLPVITLWLLFSTLAKAEGTVADTWDLSALYANDEAWTKAATEAETLLKPVEKCKGQWGKSPKDAARCFDSYYKAHKEIARLSNYAGQKASANGEDAAAQALKGQAGKIWARLQEVSSPMQSEIIAIPSKKFASFRDNALLKPYRMTLDNIVRKREHTLSAKENQILAYSAELAEGSREVFHSLTTLNLPFPSIKLSTGESVEINAPAFSKWRQSENADDRDKVFKAFFGTYKEFRETYASNFNSMVNRDAFYRKALGYKSDVEASLDSSNVPVNVYSKMIEQVRANRPLLWRYLKLKQKMMGLKELKYSDLYLPLTREKAPSYTFEEAKKISREAVKPLGDEYIAILDRSNKERWIDVYPGKGKVSGAYMDGSAYDVHPYLLMNYNNDYESVSTYLHEFGHAAHSFYSTKAQPYPYADYPTFAAEVASTFNEVLLNQHFLAANQDPKFKLFILGQALESFRTTVFRQAFFADFEWTVHELAQKGNTLTADLLDKTYLDLLKLYYGDTEGVVKVDPLYAIEWAYIPHFYNNFYVFQYTTSFIASNALAAKVLNEGPKARDAYISMLKAGGSLYPLDILKLGGVDMSGTEPYKIAFAAMEKALAEAEKIVDGMKK